MNDRIACIISNQGVINLIVDEEHYTLGQDHPNYKTIKEALLKGDADLLKTLADIPKAISLYAKGKVLIKDGEVWYDGRTLHNVITKRILELMEQGFPFEPMICFLENMMQNPSYRAITELYDFLEHKGLPITEDGMILMYKGIRYDWKDKYSGKIDYSIGNTVEVPRNEVDDDREHACSNGIHAGSLEYVRTYCTERVVLVKVNPKDVVSVPRDCSAQKIRVCKLEVLREYTGEISHSLPTPVYKSDGSNFDPKNEWDIPIYWEEEEEEEEEEEMEGVEEDGFC